MARFLCLAVLLVCAASAATAANTPPGPVIGILTQNLGEDVRASAGSKEREGRRERGREREERDGGRRFFECRNVYVYVLSLL